MALRGRGCTSVYHLLVHDWTHWGHSICLPRVCCLISFSHDRWMRTYLVLCSGFLSQREHGRDADCQVEATEVKDLCLLGQSPDMGLLQVVELVFIGSCEMGNQTSVVTGNDDTTAASWLSFIHTVLSAHTGFLASFLENCAIFVFANASNVHDGVVREEVLLRIQVSVDLDTPWLVL